MKICETPQAMSDWSSETRKRGERIACVPTMGTLHEGHLSLVRLAQKACDRVVVTIFVNPIQFDSNEDLANYPKTLESDLAQLRALDVDAVFLPTTGVMYPEGFQTKVRLSNISKNLCGKFREGHFDGVSTVVLKLFHIVKPDVAVFGDKDYQQRRLIEQMVKDLNVDIKIIGAPIVRERDGLAMSSRNRYLSDQERKRALVLYRALTQARQMFLQGETQAGTIIRTVFEMIDKERPEKVDYIRICDAETLEDVETITNTSVLALAVHFGSARLIDNTVLDPHEIR